MVGSKTIYMIHVYDPEARLQEYGQTEYFDLSKGAFTSKEVADQVAASMRAFAKVGDEKIFSVRTIGLSECETFDEWLNENAPWRKKDAANAG